MSLSKAKKSKYSQSHKLHSKIAKHPMTRIVIKYSAVYLLILFSLSSLFTPTFETKAATGPAVFFVNHQDDELWMAGGIKEHLMAGLETHVVLTTNGEGAFSREIVNGVDDKGNKVYCHYHDKYHNPAAEGYKAMTLQEFSAARNIEFVKSMRTLGVPEENIHFANQDLNPSALASESYTTAWKTPLFIDQKLTKEQATQIIDYYYAKFGEGSYKTIATGAGTPYSDYVNVDHKNFFLALWEHKGISNKRFYTNTSYGAKKTLSAEVNSSKVKALAKYKMWDPQNKKYALGYHSVKRTFDTWMTNGVEYTINDKTPPSAPLYFSYKIMSGAKVNLTWINSTASDLAGVKIVKKRGSYPQNATDGTLVYKGSASSYTENLTKSSPGIYYYSIFSYDSLLNTSVGARLGRPLRTYYSVNRTPRYLPINRTIN